MSSKNIDRNAHYFVLMHPLENCLGLIFYKSSNSREKWVECKVVEERYKVDDGYKIELRAIEDGYGKETYYQCDFLSLLNDGYIIKKESENQKVKEVTWMEPINSMARLVTSAYVVTE